MAAKALSVTGIRRPIEGKVLLVCLKNGAVPIELSHRERRWILMVYELVAVDHDVYRPRHRRIEGPTAILAYLRRHEAERVLAGVTGRLITRYGRQECAFVASNGGWLPHWNVAQPSSSEPSSWDGDRRSMTPAGR